MSHTAEGIITAGALWTQLFGDFDLGIKGIITQIQKSVVPVATAYNTDDSDHSNAEDEVEFSVEEMRAELERLMTDLHLARTVAGAEACGA